MRRFFNHCLTTGITICILWLMCFSSVQAQTFNEGMSFYTQQNFEKAAAVFSTIQKPKATLFAAKSYYALGNYLMAQNKLNSITDSASYSIVYERIYTAALVHYQQKQFGQSLSKLYSIFENHQDFYIAKNAKNLYKQLLEYLTATQRLKVMEMSLADEIKFQLLKTAIGKVPYKSLQQLFEAFYEGVEANQWTDQAEALENELSNASAYEIEYGPTLQKFSPPKGTVYNIGVMLPKVKPDDQVFEVVRSMYFGATLAAQQYNSEHENTQIYIRFVNSQPNKGSLKPTIASFVDSLTIDALIGPLFSDEAQVMVDFSKELKIPVIPPLANSDINPDDTYLFQANPTYAMHGKKMARYAVQQLGLQTFMILAQKGSKGASSAQAFKKEIEALGGQVVYSYIDEFSAIDYSMKQHTNQLMTSQKPVDAIYAPFTGSSALKIIELLADDIQTLKQKNTGGNLKNITLLGSQQWQNVNFSSATYNGLNIYFSLGSYPENGNEPRAFKNNYKTQFHLTANEYALMGYDIASFLFKTLADVGNPDLLKTALLKQSQYKGLIKNITFEGSHVNKGVKILKVSSGGRPMVQH